ncbi:MAG TPA: methyltransferase [Fibrobacteria bacterium]|nr:methyltransferase [Fibrobacteria bacterium]
MELFRDKLRRNVGGVVKRSVRAVLDQLPLKNKLEPISRNFGIDRGVPIDRHYIEAFLAEHREKIRGVTMEIADAKYTRRFGDDRVTQAMVMHVQDGYGADIVCDLSRECPREGFLDCFVLTQVLPFVYDVRSTIANALKMLKPGGCLLVTVAGITQVSRGDMDQWGHFWSFTDLSLKRLFEEQLPPECIQVQSYGNVLAATSFLYGLGRHELSKEELDHFDRDYPMIIGLVATRPVQ